MRCLEADTFSAPVIQSVHGKFNVLPGDSPEGHFLWEELSDESIHVLVGAALPRGVGMGEVEVG
jgi:hypothetical protein